jgi:FkbM family methyltransferase
MLRPVRWLAYLFDFVARADLESIRDAAMWVLARRAPARSRVIHTALGRFHCRAGTTDFIHVSPAYEDRIRRVLLDAADTSLVFLDVGACLGETSIALARRGARCFAFEPDPDNCGNLRRNITLNGVEGQVWPFELALGAEAAMLPFRPDPVNRGASGRADLAHATLMVPQRSLDELCDQLDLTSGDRLAIKIDAEGMELEVLAGARELIRRHDDVMVIAESKHLDERRLRTLLAELGLTDAIYAIDEHNVCARKGRLLAA